MCVFVERKINIFVKFQNCRSYDNKVNTEKKRYFLQVANILQADYKLSKTHIDRD